MIPIFTYLQYLTFNTLHSQLKPDFTTSHTFSFKSGVMLPFCNRVCSTSMVVPNEIQEVVSYFGSIPFRWFVHENDKHQIEMLQENNFKYICEFPSMIVDLNKLFITSYNTEISVKEMQNDEDLKIWLDVVAQSYAMTNPSEFAKFIYELKKRTGKSGIHFYCGYFEGKPIAVSVMLTHENVGGLHWVGTLPEYRNKGAGLAVSLHAILEAHKSGCDTAVLFSSPLGKPVYEKIGFEQYAMYKIYGVNDMTKI